MTEPIHFKLHRKQGYVVSDPKVEPIARATEILYGGAAGGGKSHLARIAAILWSLEIPGIQIYLFRRLYEDLIKNHLEGPTGFRALLHPWINGKHPKSPLMAGRLCEVVEGQIRFWNGSKIHLCHLQHQKDLTKYYGPEFHVLFIEEATQFSEYMIRFLRSRMRIPKQLKIPDKYLKPKEEWVDQKDPSYYFPRAIYTSNPGGVGHTYLKKGFITGFEPLQTHKAPKADGSHTRVYIPAKVDDNPSVNREEVKQGLSGLPPLLVDALLSGNWDSLLGAYFPEYEDDIHTLPNFEPPSHWFKFRTFDWGSSDPFAVYWWCVAGDDGTFVDNNGETQRVPRGALIAYREWYGCSDVDQSKGAKMANPDIAKGIVARTRETTSGLTFTDSFPFGDRGYSKNNHKFTIADDFMENGCPLTLGNTSRVFGWGQVRARLVGKDGRPVIYFTRSCIYVRQYMQILEIHPQKSEDAQEDGEATHACDCVRLACTTRPWVLDETKPVEHNFKSSKISLTAAQILQRLKTQKSNGLQR